MGGPTPRIVGGHETTPNAYPFVVSLQQYGEHFCGASLIAAMWVLTATHCVSDTTLSTLSVSVHRHDITLPVQSEAPCAETIRLARKRCYPGYHATTMIHDICLLELERAPECVEAPNLAPLDRSPNSLAVAGTSATVAGWGATYSDGYATDRLRCG